MKIGADPVAEDRATAIMWIVVTLFAIPIMIGTAFGALFLIVLIARLIETSE